MLCSKVIARKVFILIYFHTRFYLDIEVGIVGPPQIDPQPPTLNPNVGSLELAVALHGVLAAFGCEFAPRFRVNPQPSTHHP
jgi:hypothetical protein